jgi:phage portal protein BeeE
MSFSDYLNQIQVWTSGGVVHQGYTTTMSAQKTEPIGNSFEAYVHGGLMGNGVVFTVEAKRVEVFAQARFQYQTFNKGRPGDLFGDASLAILEQPWVGGTTGDLLARMLLCADFAGNAYVWRNGNELVVLRPDWVEIILGERHYTDPSGATRGVVGLEKLGYLYRHGGVGGGNEPVYFLPEDVAHFAPMPDPLAQYRGMSWLTPVVREIRADDAATNHKGKFFDNAATPNLAVSLPKEITPTQFAEFVELMDEKHQGWENAYKTLYTGGGADVTVIGADLKQLDFKVTQGAGETRIAGAAGVPPSVAGLSEGLQGSSLNAGNYGQARRQFADTTLSNLWRNCSGSLAPLVSPPANGRLWHDVRDIPFLREDQKDAAEIEQIKASTIANLVKEGFTADSAKAAVLNQDMALLEHTGMVSVQLQTPGAVTATNPPPPTAA